MSRALTWAVVIGLGLLAAALLLASIDAPFSVVFLLLATAAVMFAGVACAIFAIAWRTKGWAVRHPGGGPASAALKGTPDPAGQLDGRRRGRPPAPR